MSNKEKDTADKLLDAIAAVVAAQRVSTELNVLRVAAEGARVCAFGEST